jgi:hypothetical protein
VLLLNVFKAANFPAEEEMQVVDELEEVLPDVWRVESFEQVTQILQTEVTHKLGRRHCMFWQNL